MRQHVQSMRRLELPELDSGVFNEASKDRFDEVGVPGRATQFSVSPWANKNHGNRNRYGHLS